MNNNKGKGLPVVILLIGIGAVLVGGFLFLTQRNNSKNQSLPDTQVSTEVTTESGETNSQTVSEPMEVTEERTYDYEGDLVDVTDGNASGVAKAIFDQDEYMLMVTFENLPPAGSGYFYEGWVVRNSPFTVISTGATEIVNGQDVNIFTSDTDLTDHDFYVLTIEPDDGDPAPADHVLEGTLVKI